MMQSGVDEQSSQAGVTATCASGWYRLSFKRKLSLSLLLAMSFSILLNQVALVDKIGDKLAQSLEQVLKNGNNNTRTSPENTVEFDDLDSLIQGKVKELQTQNISYYLYDHPNITLKDWTFNPRPRYLRRYGNEMGYDEDMLQSLEDSPFRTNNPDAADLFIPLLRLGRLIFSEKFHHLNKTLPMMSQGEAAGLVMSSLVDDPIFRKHQGRNHVLIATPFVLYRFSKRKFTSLFPFYNSLYNVTVILSWDPNASYNDIHHNNNKGGVDIWHEFRQVVVEDNKIPMSRWSASVGLGSPKNLLQLAQASLEKFYNSSNFIFYHSRNTTFFSNSTQYRHAPITNITNATGMFPQSSIGYDINGEEWARNFQDSKFCLNIRGDSPHSKALWRIIRSGCIPVIIADSLPIYSPLFKSTLNMSDYSVIIEEKDLLHDAEKTLLTLMDLSEYEIESKIKHLAFAQRVIFPDHPDSLFVPAILREAKMATELHL